MNTQPRPIEKLVLPLFLILTPVVGIAIPLLLPASPVVYVTLAALVPALLALVLAAASGGRDGAGALLKKLARWRIRLQWYAVALGLPLAMHLAVGVLALVLGWIPALRLRPASLTQLIVGGAILIWAVLEEVGWRGFALPRLLARRSALASAVLLGLAWGVFHLGLGAAEGRPLLPTFLVPFGVSVVFTWLYVQTRGSLAVVIVFHTALNFFPMFLDGLSVAQSLWLQAGVNLALSALLPLLLGPGLQRGPAQPPALADAG